MKTASQDCYPFGKVYFFKNGLIETSRLTLSTEDVQYLLIQYGDRGNQMAPISTEEQTMLSCLTKQRTKRLAYQSAIEKGYSIIRVANYLEVSKNHIEKLNTQTVEAFIPHTICPEDASNIQQLFETQEQKETTVRTCVTNFLDQDFDYYNPLRISENNERKKLPSSIILDYYLREKLGQLSEEEQIMFDKYRQFNLSEILVCQNQKKYPINHADSGVILITADQCWKRTVKKMQHNPEIFSLQECAHPNLDLFGKELPQRIEMTSDIMIYLLHQNMFCFLPSIAVLTEFQKTAMNQILEEVQQIKSDYADKIFIDAEEQSYKTINYYTIEDLQNAILPKKKKLFTKIKKKRR